MSSLHRRSPSETFGELLKLSSVKVGMTGALTQVEDGHGTACPLQLSTTEIALNGLRWPTTGAAPGKVLGVSSDNQLSWVDDTQDTRYDMAFSSTGVAPVGKIFLFTTPRTFSLPGNFVGSVATSLVAASKVTAFDLYRKAATGAATKIGSITFAAGASTGTFTGTGASFNTGDMFYVDLPAADTALSDVAVTLIASLS